MIKRKLLGQHFLNSKSIAEFIVKEARISETDVVFEIGTGLGILTPLLCKNAPVSYTHLTLPTNREV